jgi:cyanophycinase
MSGVLALVGGGEWSDGCTFDARFLEQSGGADVVVLATAAAYENPAKAVAKATTWFEGLGATVVAPEVLGRRDAFDSDHLDVIRGARFVYLSDGGSLHLRSVLKESPLLEALIEAWQGGAVLAGSGAGADVLCDPMVDTRGGAYTVGLGLVRNLAAIPRYDTWSREKVHRTVGLAPDGVTVAGIPQSTALIRQIDGSWSSDGVGQVDVFVDGALADIAAITA